MIGIDTNVLLRLATGDDAAQVKTIAHWLAAHAVDEPLHVNQIVFAETLWALKSSYGFDRAHLVTFVDGLLSNAVFEIEQAALVEDALGLFETGKADFADCLIFAKNARHCDATITFDRAARGLPGCVVL